MSQMEMRSMSLETREKIFVKMWQRTWLNCVLFLESRTQSNRLEYLAEEIFKPSVEGMVWFLPVANSKIGEERGQLAEQPSAKEIRPVACDPINHLSRMLQLGLKGGSYGMEWWEPTGLLGFHRQKKKKKKGWLKSSGTESAVTNDTWWHSPSISNPLSYLLGFDPLRAFSHFFASWGAECRVSIWRRMTIRLGAQDQKCKSACSTNHCQLACACLSHLQENLLLICTLVLVLILVPISKWYTFTKGDLGFWWPLWVRFDWNEIVPVTDTLGKKGNIIS